MKAIRSDRCRFLGVPIRVLNTMPDHCYILTHRDNIVIGIEQTVTCEKSFVRRNIVARSFF